MVQETVFKTPEKVISQFGGTAISADGQVSVLLPQNAVNEDVSITIDPVSSDITISCFSCNSENFGRSQAYIT